VGNHGGELLRPGSTKAEVDGELDAWTARVREFAARAYTPEHQRIRVRKEDKQAIAAFHWRGAPDEQSAEQAVREIARSAEQQGFVVHWGRKVLEVRPPVAFDKGLGIAALLRSEQLDAALYVGDDTTDLDAFRALRELVQEGVVDRAICAGVSSEDGPPAIEEDADVVVAGTEGVRELLSALIAE